MNVSPTRLAALLVGIGLWILAGVLATSAGPRDSSGAPVWIGGAVDALVAYQDPKVVAGADPESDPAAARKVVAKLDAALKAIPEVTPDGMYDLEVVLHRSLVKERDHYDAVADPGQPATAAWVQTPGFRTQHAADRATRFEDVRDELEQLRLTAIAKRLPAAPPAEGSEEAIIAEYEALR